MDAGKDNHRATDIGDLCQCMQIGQPMLPLEHCLFKFGSWMGGDRDGNPFVTADTTRDVVISARLAAVNAFFNAIEQLMFELSIWRCNSEMQVGWLHSAGQASFMLLGVMSCTVIMSGLSRASSMHGDQLSKLGLWPHCGAVLCGWRLHRILYKSCFSYGTE